MLCMQEEALACLQAAVLTAMSHHLLLSCIFCCLHVVQRVREYGSTPCPPAGAGMIFSQGLMRMRAYDQIEHAVRTMNWHHQGAGGVSTLVTHPLSNLTLLLKGSFWSRKPHSLLALHGCSTFVPCKTVLTTAIQSDFHERRLRPIKSCCRCDHCQLCLQQVLHVPSHQTGCSQHSYFDQLSSDRQE